MIALFVMLTSLSLIDGACSGIRAGLGRTGLIRHHKLDRRGAAAGTALAALALIPPGMLVWADFATHFATHPVRRDYLRAGHVLLVVLLPFAAVVLAALTAYAALGWRRKYLAMAVILGPCTLARPWVACAAGAAGAAAGGRSQTAAAIALATVGLLVIEPTLGLWWRRRSTMGRT